jgi:acetyl-CoA C-acetyltransferase
VGIAGAGWSGFAPTTPGISYKELMFEAARRAYADAGLDPRRDVDSFVCASEDLEEGTSIFDEYVPDQLGAVQRPVHTVASDGLFALATGVMLIRSGVANVVAVEAHSKASNLLTPGRLDRFAMDPVLNRPLGVSALAIAGLEMRRYLHDSGRTVEDCEAVAARNREHARSNARASFANVTDPSPLFDPLTHAQAAESVDGCVVMVLAAEGTTGGDPVWVDGVGWNQDAPSIESRDWSSAPATRRAGEMALRQASVSPSDVDLVEVDDTFAYKQLQHLDALGFDRSRLGTDRVNPSGGALGEGHLREATGLARALACVERLRAGDARIAVAQSWRGIPSTSAAVAVLSAAGGRS